MKDYMGLDLEIGDEVVFIDGDKDMQFISRGEVCGFTNNFIKIRIHASYANSISDRIVKRTSAKVAYNK